jgi:hypothetical protein
VSSRAHDIPAGSGGTRLTCSEAAVSSCCVPFCKT